MATPQTRRYVLQSLGMILGWTWPPGSGSPTWNLAEQAMRRFPRLFTARDYTRLVEYPCFSHLDFDAVGAH